MKNSIYFRNFLATALIVLSGFIILGAVSTAWRYRLSAVEIKATMASTLQQTARYISTQYIDYSIEPGDLNLSMSLSFASNVSGFDLLIANTDGVVSACSDRDLRHIGEVIPQAVLSVAADGRYSVIMSTLGQIYPERRQVTGAPVTVRINGEPTVFGYLFVSSSTEAFGQAWREFSGVFTLIALNVMALTFLISFVTTKKLAEPLNEMAIAARRFARGDFSERVEDKGRLDEIGQLTQAFNAMADSLESSETLRREFIANISHELKTPMTVIAGFSDGILDGTIPPENEARYLEVISSETRRVSRLVNSMLDMSKLQSVDGEDVLRSSFDVSEVVRLTLLNLGSKIEQKQLDINAELPEEPVITRGDMDSIMRVTYNLLDNAIKFSDPGEAINLELWKQGGRAYISVENKGETIPAEEIPYIFDRFHKTDKSRSADREGVGLGLYIVKTILDKHNEDVYVISADGLTKFVFTLSIART